MLDEDVGRSQDPVEALSRWGEQWTMVEGKVACNVCHESQYPSGAGEQFVHGSRCTSTNPSSFPWKELKAILSLEV